jgi:hypothetical protein
MPGKPEYVKEEFIYVAGGDQPRVNISYMQDYQNEIDTIRKDTFFYDVQRRVSQISSYKLRYPSGRSVKQIHYNAASRMDTLWVYSTDGNTPQLRLLETHVFVYNGMTVKQYAQTLLNNEPVIDTFLYTYQNGNLAEWRSIVRAEWANFSRPNIITYRDYDTCFNVLRYLNINLYFPHAEFPFQHTYAPFISDNNFRLQVKDMYQAIGSIEWANNISTIVVSYQKDSIGLITSAKVSDPACDDYTRIRYEYMPAP